MLSMFVASLISLQLVAQAPLKPALVPLSESILARIPDDYRAEAKEKIRQTEEIQQQAAKMPNDELVATVFHVLGDVPLECPAFFCTS